MKIVFFGTPEYVLPVLDCLQKKYKTAKESPIAAVVTQKPKPTGRKQLLSYSAVDTWAYKKGVPKFFSSEEFLKANIPADIGILASLAEIIPENVIKYFKYGILNIHPSLLPKYRGASPVQAAIACGENQTGVSIIKMDSLLDHGQIVSQFKEEILPTDTNLTLRSRLFERAAAVLVELLPAYMAGKITPRTQDEKAVIFTRQIKKEDGFIPPDYLGAALNGKKTTGSLPVPFVKECSLVPNSKNLMNFFQALQPWPGIWTNVKLNSTSSKRLKVLKMHLEEPKLVMDEVQLEGKNPVSWQQFTQGYPNYALTAK